MKTAREWVNEHEAVEIDGVVAALEARDAEARAVGKVDGLTEGLRLGYSRGRCSGLWDAVEIAQDHEERRTGNVSEDIRAEALHADKVKAADEALIAKAEAGT